jgi:signal transduction histidine kinase
LWAISLFGLVIAGILYTAYRVRLAFLLRLERQRSRIAIDLHDEIGSGLGSIGILSGVIAEDKVDDEKRRELARKIATTSGELGNNLGEIVWALSPGSSSLEALAYHLTEQVAGLFPANQTDFSTDFPTVWPASDMSLTVRRNLQLIAMEALHNVARHANSQKVVLGVKPSGRNWHLWISDDGIGIDRAALEDSSGMGLRSMRRRAEEIGAKISWSSENNRGTKVVVAFDLRGRDRRT